MPKIACTILAGGRSTRMGGADKAFALLGGKPLISHVIARIAPQSGAALMINTNADPALFERFGLPVLADPVLSDDVSGAPVSGHDVPGDGALGPSVLGSRGNGAPSFAGPLAGVLCAMRWAAAQGLSHVATVPADVPFIPHDLIARLSEQGAPSYAYSGGRAHPTCALWPTALYADMLSALRKGQHKMMLWLAAYDAQEVRWDVSPDPFVNINTPEDLAQAQRQLARGMP